MIHNEFVVIIVRNCLLYCLNEVQLHLILAVIKKSISVVYILLFTYLHVKCF